MLATQRHRIFAITVAAFALSSLAPSVLAEYNPKLGRFMQRDSNETAAAKVTALAQAGYQDGPNLYQYAGGNPVVHLDSSGKNWTCCHKSTESYHSPFAGRHFSTFHSYSWLYVPSNNRRLKDAGCKASGMHRMVAHVRCTQHAATRMPPGIAAPPGGGWWRTWLSMWPSEAQGCYARCVERRTGPFGSKSIAWGVGLMGAGKRGTTKPPWMTPRMDLNTTWLNRLACKTGFMINGQSGMQETANFCNKTQLGFKGARAAKAASAVTWTVILAGGHAAWSELTCLMDCAQEREFPLMDN